MATMTYDIAKLTVATVDVIINRELQKPYEMYYPSIVRQVSQEKAVGTYQQLGGISGAYKKVQNAPYTYQKIVDGYTTTISVDTYANAVAASWESLCDDLYSVVESTFGQPLMQTLIDMREQLVADEYYGMFSTTGADGVYLLHSAHPLVNSAATNDNLADAGAMGVDTVKDMKNMFFSIKDQAGRKFRTRPTHILFHPTKMFLYTELFGSQLMAFELSNTKNSLPSIAPMIPLTDLFLEEAPWYMLDKTLYAGVVFQRQEDVIAETWWEKGNAEYRGSVRERYGIGTVAPGYGIIGNLGA